MRYEKSMQSLAKALTEADAVVVGAGAGFSASAGFTAAASASPNGASHGKEIRCARFLLCGVLSLFHVRGVWGLWSASILANRYECGVGEVYVQLKSLLEGKDYFVITTNVDHQFQRAGFDKKRLFYTQGDYGLFQCSRPCCQETYDNEEMVRAMYASIEGTSIDSDLVPECPHCGSPLTTNLRCDSTFVEDEGWHKASLRYSEFLRRHEGLKVLFLELGVGYNTPGIIKYPFWQMTSKNRNAIYAVVNQGEAITHPYIEDRSILVDGDIAQAVADLGALAS